MNIHKETGVRQYTCCPGGKRTSAKETVHIKGTDRTIEHTWRPHPRGVQVTSTLIKKNGQKGQVKVKVVADELETVTDVCRAHIEDIAKACKRAPLPLQQPKKETRAIVRQREACEAASRRRDGVGRREVRANPISEAISSSSRRKGGRASLQLASRNVAQLNNRVCNLDCTSHVIHLRSE